MSAVIFLILTTTLQQDPCQQNFLVNITSPFNASETGRAQSVNILRLEIKLLTFLDLELDSCRPFSSIYQGNVVLGMVENLFNGHFLSKTCLI